MVSGHAATLFRRSRAAGSDGTGGVIRLPVQGATEVWEAFRKASSSRKSALVVMGCHERRRVMIFTRALKVCLAARPADLRRSSGGLALLVRGALREDERSSWIFVFTNRRRDRVRRLYWDGNLLLAAAEAVSGAKVSGDRSPPQGADRSPVFYSTSGRGSPFDGARCPRVSSSDRSV